MRYRLAIVSMAIFMGLSIFAFGQWSQSKIVHSVNGGSVSNNLAVFTLTPNSYVIEDSGLNLSDLWTNGSVVSVSSSMWGLDFAGNLTPLPYVPSTNSGMWFATFDGSLAPNAETNASADTLWALAGNTITPR